MNPDRGDSKGAPRPLATAGDVARVPVRGLQVIAVRKSKRKDVGGELLAAEPAKLFIETARGVVEEVSVDDIHVVKGERHDDAAVAFGTWTALGALSTLTHGVFLVATAPIWLCVGGTTTVANAASNSIEIEPWRTDLLRQYARYPQGLPGSVPTPPSSPAPPAHVPSVAHEAMSAFADAGPAPEDGGAGAAVGEAATVDVVDAGTGAASDTDAGPAGDVPAAPE